MSCLCTLPYKLCPVYVLYLTSYVLFMYFTLQTMPCFCTLPYKLCPVYVLYLTNYALFLYFTLQTVSWLCTLPYKLCPVYVLYLTNCKLCPVDVLYLTNCVLLVYFTLQTVSCWCTIPYKLSLSMSCYHLTNCPVMYLSFKLSFSSPYLLCILSSLYIALPSHDEADDCLIGLFSCF